MSHLGTRSVAPLTLALCIAPLFVAAPARGQPAWSEFEESRRAVCVGGPGRLGEPEKLEVRGHTYQLEGDRLVQADTDKDRALRIGVISAIKDSRPETQAQVTQAIDGLEQLGLDVLVLNGDLATNEIDMEVLFPLIAKRGFLTVATIGNTESCGSFNRVAHDTHAQYPNFINGNWTRVLVLDDASLVTLPGYHNRAFVHTGGGAHYKPVDLEITERLARDAPQPLVFVAHGPPGQKGKLALDLAHDGGNVGNPAMTDLLRDLKVRFGIFGHILEAGGRGTDLAGKALAPTKFHPTLYVNAGSINPDPWGMLDKSTSHGMALHFELEGKKGARYRVQKFRAPPPVE